MLNGNVVRNFHIESDGQWKEIALRVPRTPGPMPGPRGLNRGQCGRFNQNDKALLEHYQMQTSLAIAADEETRAMSRTVAVRLACQHGFLMHSILALPALDQAHDASRPFKGREYTTVASENQDQRIAVVLEGSH